MTRFSIRRRTRYSSFSNSAADASSGSGPAIMICSISGRVAAALVPITLTFTGTWRQP